MFVRRTGLRRRDEQRKGEVRVGLSSGEAAGVAEVLEDLSRSLDTLRRGAEVRTCPPAPSFSPLLQPLPSPSPLSPLAASLPRGSSRSPAGCSSRAARTYA